MQSSGNYGIVVFSLGSIVKNISMDKANIIASALGQMPQKVSQVEVEFPLCLDLLICFFGLLKIGL